MKHYKDYDLMAYQDGQVNPAENKEIVLHLEKCKQCKKIYGEVIKDKKLLSDAYMAELEYKKPIPHTIEKAVLKKFVAHKGRRTTGNPLIPQLPKPNSKAPKIPAYSLLKRIGEGSCGEVWKAVGYHGPCAVKILKTSVGDKEIDGLRRLSGLHHPNILLIKHIDKIKGQWHYVMELVDDTLEKRLESGRIPIEKARQVAIDLLKALSVLHQNEIAHRDVKPGNIGFKDGVLKLIDLGLVTSSSNRDRTILGTKGYMPLDNPSPEPAQDDLYAAGKVIYEVFTGYPPYDFPKLPLELKNSDSFHRLDKAIRKACHSVPQKRFQSAGEFIARIDSSHEINKKVTVSNSRKSSSVKNIMTEEQMENPKLRKILQAYRGYKNHIIEKIDEAKKIIIGKGGEPLRRII